MLNNDHFSPTSDYASVSIKAQMQVVGYFEGNLRWRIGLTSADIAIGR